jgi:hypothetical protein
MILGADLMGEIDAETGLAGGSRTGYYQQTHSRFGFPGHRREHTVPSGKPPR